MLFIDRQGSAEFCMGDALSGTDYVTRLEGEISELTGKRAVALNSADAALMTALKACGVGRGDYVFVPTYTFYTHISAVVNVGGAVVFIDCDPATRCMSENALEAAFVWSELQSRLPKAVVIDNAFGAVADYDTLVPLCKAYGVPTVELASDAFGGTYKGKPCGANCDYGVLAFSKRVGGGGGALVLDASELDAALELTRAKYSDGENYDFRMHNVIAALDCAVLETAQKVTARAKKNLDALFKLDLALKPTDGDAASFATVRAAKHAAALSRDGFAVKTPPPVHTLPQYIERPFFEHEQGFCVSRSLAEYCLVDMDISPFMRRKLIKRLQTYRC